MFILSIAGLGNLEMCSFKIGDDDFVVHFFDNDHLKKAMKGEMADLSRRDEIMFTLWAESKEEADAWADEVRKVGGTIFDGPAVFGEGYYGLPFQTPKGISGMCFICEEV
ncbi:glyoxalase [Flavihumibacter sp. R14]|nr:glyoxalase [Flavihumibacter soli]